MCYLHIAVPADRDTLLAATAAAAAAAALWERHEGPPSAFAEAVQL